MQPNYYQPDPSWGDLTPEQFVKEHVIPSTFHAGVPQDVSKEYDVAEHLMALSYFYYPTVDSAFHKVLGIFEMAVKLRCKELDIPIEKRSRNGRSTPFTLNELIKKLTAQHLYPELEHLMRWSKFFRNHFSHPDGYQLMGMLCYRGITILVNLINSIFIPVERYQKQVHEKKLFQKALEPFQNIAVGLLTGEKIQLFMNPKVLDVFEVNKDLVFAVSFEPVFKNTQEIIRKKQSIENHLYFFQSVECSDNSIRVVNAKTKENQQIMDTQFLVNSTGFQEHQSALLEMTEAERYHYYWAKDSKNFDEIETFKLENCWGSLI